MPCGEGTGKGYFYKRVTRGILIVSELFCTVTLVVDTQTGACDNITLTHSRAPAKQRKPDHNQCQSSG